MKATCEPSFPMHNSKPRSHADKYLLRTSRNWPLLRGPGACEGRGEEAAAGAGAKRKRRRHRRARRAMATNRPSDGATPLCRRQLGFHCPHSIAGKCLLPQFLGSKKLASLFAGRRPAPSQTRAENPTAQSFS
jgi:hypothetical protein